MRGVLLARRGAVTASRRRVAGPTNLLPAATANCEDTSKWTPGDGTISLDTTTFRSGTGSLKLTPGGSPVYFYGTTSSPSVNAAPVTPGQTYTASAWIKPATNQAGGYPFAFYAEIVWLDSAGTIVGSWSTGPSTDLAAGAWGQVVSTAVAPAGVAYATVAADCAVAETSSDIWNFDDAALVAGGTPLADGGDPPPTGGGSTESAPASPPAGWTRVFTENFDTDAAAGAFLSTYPSWFAYPNTWTDTSGNGTYDGGANITVHDSQLDMKLFTAGGKINVCAPGPETVPSVPSGNNFTYGRFSVRFKADQVAGYKTAWLLWPVSDSWPADGEIDFPEGSLDDKISAYMHYADPSGGQDAFEPRTADYSQWHTAVTEWTAGQVKFYLDGVLYGTATTKVPSNPMYWVLQTETNLSGALPDSAAVAHVYVDWVTIDIPA